jgi:hypothetical protein
VTDKKNTHTHKHARARTHTHIHTHTRTHTPHTHTHTHTPDKITINLHKPDGVLRRVEEERNILHAIQRKYLWVGHFLRRNCFLKHVIEGKREGMRV